MDGYIYGVSSKDFSHPPTTKSRMNPKVDAFLHKAKQWQQEMKKLRTILLDCGLTEELKWGKPCYTFQETNIALIIGFKESCILLICQGALLKDPKGILIQPSENTQAARRIRFTHVRDIIKMETVLKDYIQEALEAKKAGLKVSYKKITEFKIPEEFQLELDRSAALKMAFKALTPGRQRAYLLYFSAAKQTKTRNARIEKYRQHILEKKGLMDEYKSKKA
jgi:uncharacterized protein YdeI (YjbR/CyaY-like superfamily)